MTTFSRSATSKAVEMGRHRAAAMEQVNSAVRRVRALFVTDLPGQEMLYIRKEAQARGYLAESPEPADASAYPLIAAEVGITAPTAAQVAQVYLNLAAIWESVGAALESVRLGAVAAIEVATSRAEIDAALATFATQMEALS